MNVIVQPAGETDKLTLHGLAGGILIDGVRRKMSVRIVDGRITFPLTVAPPFSLFRIAHLFRLDVVDVLPLEAGLMNIFQRPVVLVQVSPPDVALEPARVVHHRMGEFLPPL